MLYREKGLTIVEIVFLSLSIPQAHGIAGFGAFLLDLCYRICLTFLSSA